MSKNRWNDLKFFILLIAAASGCVALLGVRILVSGKTYHLFLAWNLFLAFVPVAFGLTALALTRSGPAWKTLPLLIVFSLAWLLFFPNSSYLFTDFIHLIQRGLNTDDPNARGMGNMLVWYDVVLKSAFAFAGHLAGMFSLYLFHCLWRKYFGRVWAWLLIFIASLAAAYGVFLGRFLRLNSWTILTRPESTIQNATSNLLTEDALFFTLAFGTFILTSYFFIYIFKRYSVEVGK